LLRKRPVLCTDEERPADAMRLGNSPEEFLARVSDCLTS
jgi:hypothetical protein